MLCAPPLKLWLLLSSTSYLQAPSELRFDGCPRYPALPQLVR